MTDRIIPPLSDRMALVAAARVFYRVPYKHRGRSMRGVDCIGLLACALKSLGHEIQDRRVYSPAPDGVLLREALCAHLGDSIPLDQLQPGDVVLMRWHRHPNHVGLITDYPGGLGLIHSLAMNKEVVEHRLADPWDRRIIEGWRP